MKSTFKVLFYAKKQSVKNGKAPIMGRNHQWNPSGFQL